MTTYCWEATFQGPGAFKFTLDEHNLLLQAGDSIKVQSDNVLKYRAEVMALLNAISLADTAMFTFRSSETEHTQDQNTDWKQHGF